jgi:hypothetical protein
MTDNMRYTARICVFPLFVLLALVLYGGPDVYAWSCKTHVFIAGQAGIPNPHAACFPDLARKENDALLGPFHWHNAAPGSVITPASIDRYGVSAGVYTREGLPSQSPLKIKVPHPAGVLYWKICDLYDALKGSAGWEYEYYLATIAHYAGDLSQPLHNFPSGSLPAADGKSYPEEGLWARKAHLDFDRALDLFLPFQEERDRATAAGAEVPGIASIHDLKREIAKVANASIALAGACYAEKRALTRQEALAQVSMSIALMKGIIAGTRERP